MASIYDQIYAELGAQYNPQEELVRKRQTELPGMVAAEEKGLEAKQGQAFDDITAGAQRRGLGFSGIPLGEQAKYTSTEYLPALARLKQSARDQATSLEEVLLGIRERRGTQARQLDQQQQDRAEQQRQFNENLAFQREQAAAQQRASASSAGGLGGDALAALLGGGGQTPAPSMQRRSDGGFNFNVGGQSISAADYARNAGKSFRSVLQEMANQGDVGARIGLKYLGDDFGVNAQKLNRLAAENIDGKQYSRQQVESILKALTWGQR